MTLTEIKKELYKQNPEAKLLFIRKGNAWYNCDLKDGKVIHFKVPVDDMGDADFYSSMDSKLLVRYIETNN